MAIMDVIVLSWCYHGDVTGFTFFHEMMQNRKKVYKKEASRSEVYKKKAFIIPISKLNFDV
jgi:hypothetical protein